MDLSTLFGPVAFAKYQGPVEFLRQSRANGRQEHRTAVLHASVLSVQLLQNLFMRGKPERFLFAVNQLTVQLNIKDAAFALHQINVDLLCLLDRGRQTGGLGCVVSHDTIRDLHFHGFSLLVATIKQNAIPRFDVHRNTWRRAEYAAHCLPD